LSPDKVFPGVAWATRRGRRWTFACFDRDDAGGYKRTRGNEHAWGAEDYHQSARPEALYQD